MPLSSIALDGVLTWAFTKANGTFSATTQGPSSDSFGLDGIDITVWTNLFAQTYTIAASGFQEFDLSSYTNLVGETVTPGHVLGLFVMPSGINAQCLLAPGSTNGLTWFFTGTTPGISIPVTAASGNGGIAIICAPFDNAGAVIDATHKTLRITNSGTGALTVTVLVITGT